MDRTPLLFALAILAAVWFFAFGMEIPEIPENLFR